MPEYCCVPQCHSRYKTNHFFKFPNSEKLKDKWVKNIPRKTWTPTKFSRVCDVHFEPKFVLKSEVDPSENGKLCCLQNIFQTII